MNLSDFLFLQLVVHLHLLQRFIMLKPNNNILCGHCIIYRIPTARSVLLYCLWTGNTGSVGLTYAVEYAHGPGYTVAMNSYLSLISSNTNNKSFYGWEN